MKHRFYKDKDNQIWLMPKELVDANVLDDMIDLDRFGYIVNHDLLIVHLSESTSA